jgi:hypothetical protein
LWRLFKSSLVATNTRLTNTLWWFFIPHSWPYSLVTNYVATNDVHICGTFVFTKTYTLN